MAKKRGATLGTVEAHRARFRAYYERNGRRHSPGHTFSTQAAAWSWLRGEQRLIDRDEWTPPAERRAAAEAAAIIDATTLGDYARDWIAKRVTPKGGPLHPRTREDYRKYLDGTLADLAAKPIARITLADVTRWHNTAAGAPSQRHKAYAWLKSVMATAALEGLIDANPCRVENATRKPKTAHNSAAVVKWLTPGRVANLAELVQPRDRVFILTVAYCCLRSGEAFALRRADLDLGTTPDGLPFGWLTVERGISTYEGQRHEGDTKTGETGNRVIPIPPHLVADLEQHLDRYAQPGPRGLLFPSTNSALAFRTASQVNGNAARPGKPGYGWHHARAVAGRPDAHLHDLRHWGSTLWDEAGTPAGLRIALMGHAQPGMTGHYTHPDTTKASPYALRVSELAGWSTQPASSTSSGSSSSPSAVATNPGVLASILATLDPDALAATLARLDADQLAEVVPLLLKS